MSFLIQMLKISVIHNFATVKTKNTQTLQDDTLSSTLLRDIINFSENLSKQKLASDGHICIWCMSIRQKQFKYNSLV